MMKNDSTLLLLHANARGGLRRKKKNKIFKNFGNRPYIFSSSYSESASKNKQFKPKHDHIRIKIS